MSTRSRRHSTLACRAKAFGERHVESSFVADVDAVHELPCFAVDFSCTFFGRWWHDRQLERHVCIQYYQFIC